MGQKSIMIIVNAVLYNRGSEALIRGLTSICKEAFPNCSITLVSSEKEFEAKANIPNIDAYLNRYNYKTRLSINYIVPQFIKRVLRLNTLADKILYNKVLKAAQENDLIFIIGADNYDKTYGMFNRIHSLNVLIRKYCKSKTVLFDCSLEEKHIDNEVVKDMNLFDIVTARESITLENFNKVLDENKVCYFPDPAFVMEPKECSLPYGWKDGYMIGINVSALVTRSKYGSNQEIVLKSYFKLIDYILKNTELSIILVPHVMQGADLSVLRVLYERFVETKRVILIENEFLKAPELKYVISKCRFFIGARTHSTIAAYSSCVPTIVIGYSVKSRGIARDLFGTEDNYVIPVSDLGTQKELVDAFKWLQANENEIRQHLNEIMPQYIAKTWEIGDLIKQLLDK
jgi:colanic acid/amylovoran biosynthesis protein